MERLAELREQKTLEVDVPEGADATQVNSLIELLVRAPYKVFAKSTVKFTVKLRNPEGPHQRPTWLVLSPVGGVVERFIGPGAQRVAEIHAANETRRMQDRCFRNKTTPEEHWDRIAAMRDEILLAAEAAAATGDTTKLRGLIHADDPFGGLS
jgi:hypothetical protein